MKNHIKLCAGLIAFSFIAVSAYAAGETSGVVAPVKTLTDFQREYSGTKPVVAFLKYYEYKALLEMAPRPTLDVAKVRMESNLTVGTDDTKGTKHAVASLNGGRR